MTLTELEILCDKFNNPKVGSFDFNISPVMEFIPKLIAVAKAAKKVKKEHSHCAYNYWIPFHAALEALEKVNGYN